MFSPVSLMPNPVSPQANIQTQFADLSNQIKLIEREYANANLSTYTRNNPNLSQSELLAKIETDKVKTIKKLYDLFPNLEANKKMSPEEAVKMLKNASSRIYEFTQNEVSNLLFIESGLLSGVSDGAIKAENFVSTVKVSIPTGQKIKQFIQVLDEDNNVVESTDYILVDEYKEKEVSIIKDSQALENTMNSIIQQARTQATQEVENQLDSFRQEATYSSNIEGGTASVSKEQIRFEAAKLFQELSTGLDVIVDNGVDSISLNLGNTNKQLTAKVHYLDVLEDLIKTLLEVNGINFVEDTKLVSKRVALPDGTYVTKEVPELISQYKLDQYQSTAFGKTLFNKIRVESKDTNGNIVESERNIFNIWLKQLHTELGQDVQSFLSNPSNLTISQENDSKIYDLFISSMDKANIETPKLTGGNSQNDDWEPNVPMNMYKAPEPQKGLFGEVSDILKQSHSQNNQSNPLLMSNHNNINNQNNNNSQLENNTNNLQNNNNPPKSIDPESLQDIASLHQALGLM